jgi:hypothetical protein
VQCDFLALVPKTHLTHLDIQRTGMSQKQIDSLEDSIYRSRPDNWICTVSFGP